ncbi:M28 family peptidase [Parvularcula sp. ZS-1/3]|uniref:M28 family peptidase n=1 Tax=Parvularcula mediterranea TaxID=2732508 RepID=A0A7Y3W5X1_9PROT|nr:M28 family peptidase [Parvularcula mediterranea]NNU17195.1 M28 family peptidase [Parvularcula mediterranea]
MGRIILPLAGLLVLAFLVLTEGMLNPPSPGSADFDTAGAKARLARVIGTEGTPHTVDTEEADAVRARLIEEIKALGYTPRVTDNMACRNGEGWARCARVRNVVFRAGPDGGGAALLSAHYDSVPTGPGAGDAGIGVAALLEIAEQLKGRDLERPVIFLLNEGEEVGLLGAVDFVKNDPDRDDVAFVINMEARGSHGPVMMFQTSSPNAPAVNLFAGQGGFRVSNSVMTDVYEMMPNDTDLTVFLPKGYAGINLAILAGVENYHTSTDNLDVLSERSIAHMGTLATGALEAYLADGLEGSGSKLLFTDILGRGFVTMSPMVGFALIGLGLVAFGYVALWPRGERIVHGLRIEAVPVLAVAAALLAAIVVAFVLKLVRAETSFWIANPVGFRLALYGGALLGCVAALGILPRDTDPIRRGAAGWLFFSLCGAILSYVIGGAGILFAVPLIAGLLALGVAAWKPEIGKWALVGSAAFAVMVWAPMLQMLEWTFSFSPSWVTPVMASVLITLVLMPLAERGVLKMALGTAGGAAFVGMIAAALLPAYTLERPAHLNLTHVTAEGASFVTLYTNDDPAERLAPLSFERGDVPGYGSGLLRAPVDLRTGPEAQVTSGPDGGLVLRTAGADETLLRIPSDAGVTAMTFMGQRFERSEPGGFSFTCIGRACDSAAFEVETNGEAQEWQLFHTVYGLPPEYAAMADALPKTHLPVHRGHRTRTVSLQTVPAEAPSLP